MQVLLLNVIIVACVCLMLVGITFLPMSGVFFAVPAGILISTNTFFTLRNLNFSRKKL